MPEMRSQDYLAEHGCKWRGLPEHFGKWYSIYMRANRWAKKGVLDKVFAVLQEADVINIQVDQVSLDSTIVKVHPDGTGALKNGQILPYDSVAVRVGLSGVD